ncbi:hypothetical protein PRZ48_004562 [Zasmidium cellare]|uniref:Peptidase S9 prolyl oligopeptidase catalytic domain-containing protein n=1 Tax=Zasmidium cellare TaxID=395010 RepID=A0ABR0EQ96_ZASCE|nr:hypothetical protein PRZ48_004562 [Zasmidium cellare]
MPPNQDFSIEALLSAPSRSPGVPSHDGKFALYGVTTHSFGDNGGILREVRMMDLETETSVQISDDDSVHDARWIPGNNDVAYLRSCPDGKTELIMVLGNEKHVIAKFEAPVRSLKLHRLEDGRVVIMVVGLVGPDGSLFNEKSTVSKSTGRIFDTINVRNWNVMYKAQRYSLWYTTMELQDGQWKIGGQLLNLLPDSVLEPTGVYAPEDPGPNFDISEAGVTFATKEVATSRSTVLDFSRPYYIALQSFDHPPHSAPQEIQLPPGMGVGDASNFKFSPDGSRIGFIHSESTTCGGGHLLVAATNSLESIDVLRQIGLDTSGDNFDPPIAFEFADSHDNVLFLSEQRGHTKCTIGLSDGAIVKTLPPAGPTWSFSPNMVTEIDIAGDEDHPIHCFVLRPDKFDETKTYPWVLMIHGGPVSAWADAWNPRPNITGSTGYGLAHAKRKLKV